jgi:hypothetical protein
MPTLAVILLLIFVLPPPQAINLDKQRVTPLLKPSCNHCSTQGTTVSSITQSSLTSDFTINQGQSYILPVGS